MLRVFIYYVLPFILPFLGYFAYVYLVTRGRRFLEDTPWVVLTISGLALVVVSLVSLALWGGAEYSGEYVPPSFEDGEIVPGRMEGSEEWVPGAERPTGGETDSASGEAPPDEPD